MVETENSRVPPAVLISLLRACVQQAVGPGPLGDNGGLPEALRGVLSPEGNQAGPRAHKASLAAGTPLPRVSHSGAPTGEHDAPAPVAFSELQRGSVGCTAALAKQTEDASD